MTSAIESLPLAVPSQLISWEHQVESGVTLRGWRTPASGKPVLHFMHGNGFCGLTYWPLLTLLTHRYDLFLHDILGHGDSDSGHVNWGWNRNAEIAHKVWQQFQPEYGNASVIGLGHSMGGVHTLLWAAHQPEVFSRLLLLDPVIFTPVIIGLARTADWLRLKRSNSIADKAAQRRNEWLDYYDAKNFFTGRGMFKGWADAAVKAYVSYAMEPDGSGKVHLKCSPQRESENFARLPAKLWPSVRQIVTPTNVLFGEDSYRFVHKSVARALRINPNITAEQHPGGHCFMLQYPGTTADWILKVLE